MGDETVMRRCKGRIWSGLRAGGASTPGSGRTVPVFGRCFHQCWHGSIAFDVWDRASDRPQAASGRCDQAGEAPV